MHLLRVTIAFLLVGVLMSCGMQKRLYNKGFYISKRETVKQARVDTVAMVLHTIKQPVKEKAKALLAQLGKINVPTPEMKKVVLADGCDTIFYKDGSAYLAKITESKFRTVTFYPCYTNNMEKIKRKRISRRAIHHIHYANGLYETKYVDPNSKPTWIHSTIGLTLTIVAFVLGVALLFSAFGALTAAVLSIFYAIIIVCGVVGLAMNFIMLFTRKHSTQPDLVLALAIIDFAISLPLV